MLNNRSAEADPTRLPVEIARRRAMRAARSIVAVAVVASLLGRALAAEAAEGPDDQGRARRAGRVRVEGHSLVDDKGPFLGLGASYFTALWRARHDRPRL